MKLVVKIQPMHLFVLIIIYVSLISANYISDHLKKLDNVKARIDAAIDIINVCFSNEAKYGTAFVGSVEDFNIDLLINYGPVIIFDNESITAADDDKLDKNYKLNIFIVTLEPDFEMNIKQLKKSPWWNHEGFFIIIDNGPSNTTKCKGARNILQKAWKIDILRGIFICTGGENNRVNFYTFNPFTNRAAPSFWKKSKYVKKNNTKDEWTLYRRQYNPKLLNCKSLDYDKTRHLDGYKGVRALFNGKYAHEEHKAVIKFLYEQLNVTLSYTKMNDAIDVNTQGIVSSDIGNLLVNGSIDIRLRFLTRVYLKNIAASDVVWPSGITLISQNRGKKSMFDQIYDLFGWRLILIMLFFSATTVLMFKTRMKMNVELGILEIVRMWSNASFLKQPTDLPSRIYLFGIFLLALIICSVFQGKILGFQLNPNPEKNIDTVEDLIVKFPNYKIYGSTITLNFLDEKLINRSMAVRNIDSCIKPILNDSSSVCVFGMLLLRDRALQNSQLYLAKEPFINVYTVLPIRKNWPLKKRVDDIIKKYTEHELLKYKLLLANKIRNKIDSSDEPKSLKRQHINFALKFLATGLAIGFFIFIIELIWHDETRSIILQMSIWNFIRNIKRKLRIYKDSL